MVITKKLIIGGLAVQALLFSNIFAQADIFDESYFGELDDVSHDQLYNQDVRVNMAVTTAEAAMIYLMMQKVRANKNSPSQNLKTLKEARKIELDYVRTSRTDKINLDQTKNIIERKKAKIAKLEKEISKARAKVKNSVDAGKSYSSLQKEVDSEKNRRSRSSRNPNMDAVSKQRIAAARLERFNNIKLKSSTTASDPKAMLEKVEQLEKVKSDLKILNEQKIELASKVESNKPKLTAAKLKVAELNSTVTKSSSYLKTFLRRAAKLGTLALVGEVLLKSYVVVGMKKIPTLSPSYTYIKNYVAKNL